MSRPPDHAPLPARAPTAGSVPRTGASAPPGSGSTGAVRTAEAMGVWAALRWACARDLRLLQRSRAEPLLALAFFALVSSLFPLTISPDPGLLRTLGPGIVWIAALLAMLLGLPRLFVADHADGSLEQILLAAAPLPALMAGKVLAHWLAHCLPLIALAPLIGLQFGLNGLELVLLVATLVLGTPTLCWLGAIGQALTLGSRGGATLLALLVLPLAIPVLIFATSAIDGLQSGLGVQAQLSALGAAMLVACVLGPAVCALAVRIAFE